MLSKVKAVFKVFSAKALKILKWAFNLPSAFIRVNLSHNTGTKVFSLLLAILFWFFVMDQVDPEITRVFENIPVNLINMQELEQSNLKIMNQHDYLVNVEVTGRRNNVLNMNANAIYLWTDMRTVRNGVNNVYINRTINSDSVSIKSVLPNEIVLTVERIVSVPKPVRIVYNDRFQNTYFEQNLAVSPEEIRVVGPESLVNSVDYLGAFINVGTFTEDVTREVSLAPYNREGEVVNGVTLEKSVATMNLSIGKSEVVPIRVDLSGTPAEGYQIVQVKVIPEEISILGSSQLTSFITEIYTEPIVLTGEETSSFIVQKNLLMPEGISHLLNDGIQVEIEIEEIHTKEFGFSTSEIPIMNLNDAFVTNLNDIEEIIAVKVIDVESKILNLNKSDVSIVLNFANVERPGMYRMELIVQNRDAYGKIEVEPEYLDLMVYDVDETDDGSVEIP